MNTINKEYFFDMLEERKLSLRALAKRMNMAHSQLSATLYGKRRMQLDEAAQISQILGAPLIEIVSAMGIEAKPALGKRVRLAGFLDSRGMVSLYGGDVIESVAAPFSMPARTSAVQVRDTSAPADGWVLFYEMGDNVDASAVGRLSVCELANGSLVVGTVKPGDDIGTFNVTGFYDAKGIELRRAAPVIIIRP
jgi:transcriptional regulator with XRE-family HTH domain